MKDKLNESAAYLRKFCPDASVGIILGSGLGNLTTHIKDQQTVEYSSIPHFPVSTVEGHRGRFVFGILDDKPVAAMEGRFHYYEGYSLKEVVYPVYVMKKLGISTLIVTNAAGGINTSFLPGTLMLITDHINLLADNPLIGSNDPELGPRFPGMSNAYSRRLRELAREAATEENINYHEGVYAAMTGPSYETAAEIRYLRTIGADAVGMSTVPEVIAAAHLGIEVLGISCITNLATGVSDHEHSHESVVATAQMAEKKIERWVRALIDLL